ncbi:hypothetical protein HZA40_00825 [Candidatus Peregrinibacteria bacterium]|nr:hypothetical protein [Candidatus Peregrinibacteria bacterium]
MNIIYEGISEGLIKYLRILLTSSVRFKTDVKALRSNNPKDHFAPSSEDLQALMKDFFIPINKSNQTYCYIQVTEPINPKIRVYHHTANLKSTIELDEPALVLIIEEMMTEKELRRAWKDTIKQIKDLSRENKLPRPDILDVLNKKHGVKRTYSNIDLWLKIYELRQQHEKDKVKNSFKQISEIIKDSSMKKNLRGITYNDTDVRNFYYQIRDLIKSL